ncbi:MAG: GNAT family N-acetyltransferase [Pseudonocardiaceae bacterium]|nr:GNAT family N-acetyltransferase [Pseudonocardiaceae bacterium]
MREYTPADRDAVTALSLRAWAPVFDSIQSALRGSGVYELQYPNGWADAQETAVGDTCDSEAIHLWVAEEDNVVAGFTAVQLHESDKMGEIYMLAVDPGYQRRGIAADLTGAAITWMRDQGMTSAMVETGGDPGHAAARSTYEASGFHLMPIARYFQAL